MEPEKMQEFIDMKITDDGLRYGLKCKRSECIYAQQAPKETVNIGDTSVYIDQADIDEPPAPPAPPPKEESKDTPEEKKEVFHPVFTGLFNDDLRRVDMVLVMYERASPEVNKIKAKFFVNLSRIGIDIEIEPGVLIEHKSLLFVKLHATNRVLGQYGYPFGVEKLFKDKNLKRENQNNLFQAFTYHLEREWIKLVQRYYEPPLRYSTHARSYIVFMLLQYTSFGEYENYVGLNKLLDRRIILDALPLHDGPYFYKEKQDFTNVNARQILFYKWAGFGNFYMFQPLHMIHEYMGPKIAFYFAFYEFYNKSLIPLAIFGLIRMFPYAQGSIEKCYTKHLCNAAKGNVRYTMEERPNIMCSTCGDIKACKLHLEGDNCLRKTIINSWDNMLFYLYSAVVCIWALYFLRYWVRKQNYLIWAWELCHPPNRRILRSVYKAPDPVRSSTTKAWKRYPMINPIPVIIQFIMGLLLLVPILLPIIGLSIKYTVDSGSKMEKYLNIADLKKKDPLKLPPYYSDWYRKLVIYQVILVGGLYLFEYVCSFILPVLVASENHRLQETYEQSLVYSVFIIKAACAATTLVFFGWIKGAFHRWPTMDLSPGINIRYFTNGTTNISLPFLRKLFHARCDMETCYDEVLIAFIITLTIREFFSRVWMLFWCYKTDYNLKSDIQNKTPEWELEYKLPAVTEFTIIDKFCKLGVQFMLLAWFSAIFPYMVIMVWVFNIWHIRHEARVLLQSSRRPMLFRSVGAGAFNKCLAFVCYATGFAVSILLARQSLILYSYVNKSSYENCSTFIGNSSRYLQQFDLTRLKYTIIRNEMSQKELHELNGAPCALYEYYILKDPTTWRGFQYCYEHDPPMPSYNKICPTIDYAAFLYFQGLLIAFYQLIVLFFVVITKYYIDAVPSDTRSMTLMQNNVLKMFDRQFVENPIRIK